MDVKKNVTRRGEDLKVHILYTAKEVFLEMGFERASMDAIVERAAISKRTLYAHFENKEKLYLAVIELVRTTFLSKLRSPGDYSNDAREALSMFCAQYLGALLFAPIVRMCRMAIAEVDRFPEGSRRCFEVIFTEPHERLSAYLKQTYRLSPKASASAAQQLLGRLVYPAFPRAVFGLDAQVDQKRIRKMVTEVLGAL